MVFVVERRTTKFLPMKQYRNVLGCGLVYHDHENFSTNWPKIHSSRKILPPKNTHYMVPMPVGQEHMLYVSTSVSFTHSACLTVASSLSLCCSWEFSSSHFSTHSCCLADISTSIWCISYNRHTMCRHMKCIVHHNQRKKRTEKKERRITHYKTN